MKKWGLIILCFIFCFSCVNRQIEFDKTKWDKNFDGTYKFREFMTNDLLKNHLRKGMTYQQMIDLIGKPENYGNLKHGTVGYTVMEDYGLNIDPVESKVLLIELTNDSLVKNFKIEHYKK